MVAPLVPEGPRKQKILRRLQDGKVGPSTASVYNYVAKGFFGLEPVSIDQQGFQKICDLNPQQLNAVAYRVQNMDNKVVKAYLAAMEKSTAAEPTTSATEPQMQMPPGGLYQRTPKEASGRDKAGSYFEPKEDELQEAKKRDLSYNKLNEQKQKKLFKALIQG